MDPSFDSLINFLINFGEEFWDKLKYDLEEIDFQLLGEIISESKYGPMRILKEIAEKYKDTSNEENQFRVNFWLNCVGSYIRL